MIIIGIGREIYFEDNVTRYLKEINKYPVIKKKEEEVRLAIRYRKGDKNALEVLIKANLRFVVSVAREYQNQGLPLSDLINEGNLGLIKAIKRFDETRKFKLISYAVWWIRQKVLQAIAEQSRLVKIPLNRVGDAYHVGQAYEKLTQAYHRRPTVEEVADHLKIEKKDVEEALRIRAEHERLDQERINDREGKTTLADILADPHDKVEEMSEKRDQRTQINELLKVVNEREEKIIRMYYGVGLEDDSTLEEIGHKMKLTKERVRQIKDKGIRRMKKGARIIKYKINS